MSENRYSSPNIVGKCPLCGQNVVEKNKLYQCSSIKYRKGYDGSFEQTAGCGFKLWKTIANKELPEKAVRELLANGETSGKVEGFISKAGKPFSAKLKLRDDASGVDFVFGSKPKQKPQEQAKPVANDTLPEFNDDELPF